MTQFGVCSWSLQPASPSELVAGLEAAGVRACQLALDPLLSGQHGVGETRRALEAAGITVLSGMMGTLGEDYSTLESIARTGGLRPDEHWSANLAAAGEIASLSAELGLSLVTMHAGFLPHERGDAERGVLLERLRQVARLFAQRGVRLGLETGQESAETLSGVLEELGEDNVGVNFDPANMLLYGMGDPVAALEALAPHVLQIHVKDATPAERPGQWGLEVPAGEGAVDWTAFFDALRDRSLDVDLVIEREAGEQRVADIATAAQLVERELQRIGRSISGAGQ